MAEGFLRSLGLVEMFISTFVLSFFSPFYGGLFSTIPAIATLALVVGLVACFKTGSRPLAYFGALIGLTLAVVVVAGFLWEAVRDDRVAAVAVYSFLGLQIVLTIAFLWRLRRLWLAAVPLAIFNVVFALVGGLHAVMAMTGNWL
jgi:hypothetical protein